MMRPGDKLASYEILAAALRRLKGRDWSLLLVGDGPARDAVRAAFAWAPPARLRWLGQVEDAKLPALYAACDLLLWPAINEAYGMALLEAQAASLPVVAGAAGGVPTIVTDGQTGALAPPGDAPAFAAAVAERLESPGERRRRGAAAAAKIVRDHDLGAAAPALDGLLRSLGAGT
jgi:glycosyltransferase involved in cell wall biosynthesis